MTIAKATELEKKRDETLPKLQEVKMAIKTLCFLYSEAGGRNKPKCAGVVLRRFQLRERDLISFLDFLDGELLTKTKKGATI